MNFSIKKIKLNIEGKNVSLDFNQHFANLVKVNQSLNQGAYKSYKNIGLTYVDVPEIVGITGACENVDTLFKVNNRCGTPLYFSQTGQLSLEQSLQSFPGVFTVIHSGRDEEIEDERHLRQFRLTEEEFDCSFAKMSRKNYDEEKMFDVLLIHIQNAIQSMIKSVLKDNQKNLNTTYGRNIKMLKHTATSDFLKIDYTKAVKLLNKNGYPDLHFGDDLKAHHEAKIVSLLNTDKTELPVFITRYPKEIKFFSFPTPAKAPVRLSASTITKS